jgi:hypothetical protein
VSNCDCQACQERRNEVDHASLAEARRVAVDKAAEAAKLAGEVQYWREAYTAMMDRADAAEAALHNCKVQLADVQTAPPTLPPEVEASLHSLTDKCCKDRGIGKRLRAPISWWLREAALIGHAAGRRAGILEAAKVSDAMYKAGELSASSLAIRALLDAEAVR